MDISLLKHDLDSMESENTRKWQLKTCLCTMKKKTTVVFQSAWFARCSPVPYG